MIEKTYAIAISIAALGSGICGCGGESRVNPSDAGTGADTAQVSCISTQCASKVGGARAAPADLCGTPPNGGDAYVIWYGGYPLADSGVTGSAENCVCQQNDAGTFTSCTVVTPSQCAAQTACGSCNATPACAWCKGSTKNSQPYCDFRPAFDCVDTLGSLAKPDCSQ